jgi:hypothetical protein
MNRRSRGARLGWGEAFPTVAALPLAAAETRVPWDMWMAVTIYSSEEACSVKFTVALGGEETVNLQ